MIKSIKARGMAVLLAVSLVPFTGAGQAFASPGGESPGLDAAFPAEVEPIHLDIPEIERPFDGPIQYVADESAQAVEPSVEVLSADEGGIELLSAVTTFSDLKAAIAAAPDGGTVEVGADIEVEGLITLAVNKTVMLTSEAGGTYTLSRSATVPYLSDLFQVSGGAKLVLTDIVIDGGGVAITEVTGSLIRLGADGHLEVNDGAVLQNNIIDMASSTGYNLRYNGAAVNAVGEGATMAFNDGCLIDGNSAPVQEGDSGHGGAVSGSHHFEGAPSIEITVNGGTFSNNSAGSGGAFCVGRNSTLTVNDGEFLNNTDLNYFGGAIWSAGVLNIYGGTFDGNVGSRGGGAVSYMGDVRYGSSFTMTGGAFTNNTGGGLGLGGAINLWGTGPINITGGTIGSTDPADGNAGVAGGGICIVSGKGSAPITIGGTVKVLGNSASDVGGGIAYTTSDNNEDNGTLTLSGDLEVAYNHGNQVGGVYINNGDEKGAAIMDADILGNVEIHDNKTDTDCGGLYMSGFDGTVSGNVSIADNVAANIGGGVILTQRIGITTSSFTFSDDVEISGNEAFVAGGIILSGGCGARFADDASITDNSVTGISGGVHIAVNATLTMKDRSVISGNTAAVLGSGVIVFAPSTLNVQDATQIGTSDTDNGIYFDSKTHATILAGENLLAGARINVEGLEDGAAVGSLIAKRADGTTAVTDESIYMEWTPGGLSVVRDSATPSQYVLDEAPPAGKALSIARLYGADRYTTGKQVATYGRDISTETTLIVASGHNYNFPDALAASSLSGALGNAPILMSDPSYLPSATRDVMAAATSVSKIYIIGDTPSVSANVEAEIAALLPSAEIVRLAGATRMQTAELVYKELGASASKTAVIARSMDFPDSLSVSSWAAHTQSPIFLTDFAETGLTQGTLDALASGGFERILVLGSELSVPASVVSQALAATGLADSDAIRLGGIDRVDTSVKIAEWATDPARGAEALSYDNVAVTRADSHTDALAGGALQGMHGSVILLTWTDRTHPGVLSVIGSAEDGINEIRFFGDEKSVAVSTMQAYVKAIQFEDHAWKPDNSVAFDLG